MKKFIVAITIFCIITPIHYAFGAQINGNVMNLTNQTIYVNTSSPNGHWYGPGQEGNPQMNPHSQAGYSQTSSDGLIQSTITVSDDPNFPDGHTCQFYLDYESSDYGINASPADGSTLTCTVAILNCSSCANLVVNSSSTAKK